MLTSITDFIIQHVLPIVLLLAIGLSFSYVAGRIITYPVEKVLREIKEIMIGKSSESEKGNTENK